MNSDPKLGLVLTSGGARSAYQAGVLAGLNQVASSEGVQDRFRPKIIAGTSGGAINAAYLACNAERWDAALSELWTKWETLKLKSVIKSDTFSVFARACQLASQLGLGEYSPTEPIGEFLDTEPLALLLSQSLDFSKLRANISSGIIQGLGLTTTHYATGSAVTFYQGAPEIQAWMRSHRIGKRTVLGLRHVLASASIPFLFAPVEIHGSYYGDGAIRMSAPLSPAIHMGADKILAIGVRYFRTPHETFELNRTAQLSSACLADILGVLMNSLFLDALDSDLERVRRINATLALLPKEVSAQHPEKLRNIPVLAIHPSMDLAELAKDEFHHFSWILKHFLKGLGASEFHGSDLLSYLAFESTYTTRLLELGMKDGISHRPQFLKWLSE